MKEKTTKKRRGFSKLIPAACMLLISATTLVSSTYAWFTMNREVQVTGMKVQAKAEGGLLINEVAAHADTNWDDHAVAVTASGVKLVPTSTTAGTAWFHANSKAVNDEAGADANGVKSNNLAATGYESLTLTEANTAAVTTGTREAEYTIYYQNKNGTSGYQADSLDDAYYIMYKYYLKASNDSGVSLAKTENSQNVAIKEVTATVDGTSVSVDLNKALRVGVKMGSKMYIYAPMYATNATIATYYVTQTVSTNAQTGDQTITNAAVDPYKTNDKVYTALTNVPGINTDGVEVDVYIWFEGEDDNCQSDKVTETLDNITVDIKFSLETLDATAASTATTQAAGNNEFPKA